MGGPLSSARPGGSQDTTATPARAFASMRMCAAMVSGSKELQGQAAAVSVVSGRETAVSHCCRYVVVSVSWEGLGGRR